MVVRLFLEKGAHVDARDGMGDTALLRTVFDSEDETMIELLLEKGGDINAGGRLGSIWLGCDCRYVDGTALHRAARDVNEAMVAPWERGRHRRQRPAW
jgi:ankyrin repeat protein